MNKNVFSNHEFEDLKKRLNKEILRRGTYNYNDPLTTPAVGEDRSEALSLPIVEGDDRIVVNDKTYTINTPSTGSIEETRNAIYESQGTNPGGQEGSRDSNEPNTSAAQVNVDELRNFLVGLSKIQDVNLFYGRDEINELAFRDPSGIEEALQNAENSQLHTLLHESDNLPTRIDPLTGEKVTYPMEDGIYVMPSGEFDGEEVIAGKGLGPSNFYDDYGAKPGDSNYHPYNRFTSPGVRRDIQYQNNDRSINKEVRYEGDKPSTRFGPNPRNPEQGDQYHSVPVYGGKKGACNVACTGLCSITCDDFCSESCTTTCFGRCGNACTSNCGQVCTGCSSLCYNTCKTKCQNSVGYSCVNAGAETMNVRSDETGNHLSNTTYSCNGCSYSCQFYPNKKTECWDNGCMSQCFIQCVHSCVTSCYGGCVNNQANNGDGSYKTGIGRGCQDSCTLNCIGFCSGVCEGYCVQTCWHGCKSSCEDNCTWTCSTTCGSGCAQFCTQSCTGCVSQCSGLCSGYNTIRACNGCSMEAGCTSNCKNDCNGNCMGWGCRSICGTESSGACEANCRLGCAASSCTAMCSDACSNQCTTCVNTCGFQCGTCSGMCSIGCTTECNVQCSTKCANNCSTSCVQSCTDTCGGCSNLCYSCVGMCIGTCSVKCENGCSLCANQCGSWCDSQCNQVCVSNCDNLCIQSCSNSCISFLSSETHNTTGPERDPTAVGYIYEHPKNRWEERESFRLFRTPKSDPNVNKKKEPKLITVQFGEDRNLQIIKPNYVTYIIKQTSVRGGIYDVNETTGEVTINTDMIPDIVETNQPNMDGGGGIFIIIFTFDSKLYNITADDFEVIMPHDFDYIQPIRYSDDEFVLIIRRDVFLLPEEE